MHSFSVLEEASDSREASNIRDTLAIVEGSSQIVIHFLGSDINN